MSKANGKIIPLAASQLLNELEERLAKSLESFKEGCAILAEIRDKGLWEYEYTSFEAYCRKKWGIGKSRAYQLVESHETLQLIDKAGGNSTIVENEAQVRALIKAAPEDRPAILKAVQDQGPITAKAIRQEIAKRNPKPPEPKPEIKPARVIDIEPVEKSSAEAAEQPKPSQVQIFAKQMRALADDMEADEAFSMGEFEFDAFIQRLSELVFEMRAIKKVEAA